MGPQQEQTISERYEFHSRAHNRQQDIGLDGEHIVLQTDIFEFALPPAH